jgi:stage II sporulation protein AA (anti-sigma F factor antagonist)
VETRLELSVEQHDGTTVVTAAGEIDFETSPVLRECLEAVTSPMVVVDLRAVSFLDSSAVGVLIAAQNRLFGFGGANLTLRKPQGIVRTTLEVLGLLSWIED